MTEKSTKLELTWIGKEERPRLEPRILLEDASLAYHAQDRGDDGIFDNRLVFGDNLLALKSLSREFSGKIKLVYIDPPYNSGNAFKHYNDSLEHSVWLSFMRDRIELLHRMLRTDGFFCCQIDDSEGQYLKVVLDEVFGRSNYVTTLYIQVRYADKTLKQDMAFHKQIEQVHVYRKDYGAQPNLPSVSKSIEKFCFYVREKARGSQILVGGRSVTLFTPSEYEIVESTPSEEGLKEIWASGTILEGNSSGRFFRDHLEGRVKVDGLGALYKVPGIGDDKLGFRYFTGPRREGATKGKYYQGVPLAQIAKPDEPRFVPIENFYDLAGQFGNCRNEGGVDFRGGKKPERLLELIIERFSAPGDWVLDSFAGSGTTGAAAHKMKRRWILVEFGDHCHSHIIPRMKRVIDGSDTSGITDSVGWQGGGGFRFYRLAPSLLQLDRWNNWVVNKEFNPEMLAEAVCKLENFTYAPSQEIWWQHGHSTERDFIYVTTQALTHPQLAQISDDVGPDRTLLICCGSFRANVDAFPNLTVKKIPKAVMHRCEWGRDDYSLSIAALPEAPGSADSPEPKARKEPTRARAKTRKSNDTATLFSLGADEIDVTKEER